jgi:hypothetical protein
MLIPLSTFFAISGNSQLRISHTQKEAILNWFWRTCFNKRYNSQPAKTIQADIEGMLQLKEGKKSSITSLPYNLTNPDLFKNEQANYPLKQISS